MHSHGLLLTLLGLHGLITLSFTRGVHGLCINPVLTYFITSSLLWPILTFLLPMGLLLLSMGSFRPACFFRGPFIILWAYDPSFLLFELNGFFLNLLTLFYPYYWASSYYWAFPKWASLFSPLSIWSTPAVHTRTKDFLLLAVFPFFFFFFFCFLRGLLRRVGPNLLLLFFFLPWTVLSFRISQFNGYSETQLSLH